jgi:hypothetical protein
MYYNLLDEVLDVAVARQGRDNSIGFTQIKVSATRSVCEMALNPSNPYYLGPTIKYLIPCTTNRDSLLTQLLDPRTNLVYATAYSAMILSRWKTAGYDISTKPEIFATLYNLGPFRSDGSERIPHSEPKPSSFGERAAEFYYSTLLIDEFPREGTVQSN